MFNSLEMSFHCQDRQNSYYMYNSNLTLESSGLVFGEVHTMTKFLPGGGGGTPLYKLYKFVPPHRVRFCAVFV